MGTRGEVMDFGIPSFRFNILLSFLGWGGEEGEIIHNSWFGFWFTGVTKHVCFSTSSGRTTSVFLDFPEIWGWTVLSDGVLHIEIWVARPIPTSEG